MSARNDRKDRALMAALSVVLLGGILGTFWAYMKLEDRRIRLIENYLAGQEQAFHARLDGFFLGMEEELSDEVMALPMKDQRPAKVLFERWEPLLASRPSILRISLADQRGDEQALIRTREGLLERTVFEGSATGPAIETYRALDDAGHDSIRLSKESRDPRRETWFARALEDNLGTPVWTLAEGSNKEVVLQVSQLIRPSSDSLPLQVMMLEVSPGSSRWLDTRTLAFGALHGILFDGGRKLLGFTRSSPMITDTAEAQRLLRSGFDPSNDAVFEANAGDMILYAQAKEHPLNGLLLYTLLLLDPAFVDDWMSAERMALLSACGVLVLIGILLLWTMIRGRERNERIRQTARKLRTTERRLAKATGERDVLNREVHHRVKNNLQVVSSLLNLQASRLEEGPVRSEFLRGKRRIDIIALVHHRMYDLKDLRNVDLQQFFEQLIASLGRMHEPMRRSVSHEVNAHGVKADQDTAIELGIILCELVTNTYEHAFPYATGGHVDITVQAVDSDLHRLIVRDNGKGLKEERIPQEGKLGLEIVEALAEQMNGSLHTHSGVHGATFEVLFRMNWNNSASEVIDPQGAE